MYGNPPVHSDPILGKAHLIPTILRHAQAEPADRTTALGD
ncbi:hypothetical protein OOU_Y34scaffold00295g20 [Pyricularia oryzae Y34]|uniref:Uncharacterized protein n=2 Tax=Pyricularia oryzae TaxID=318829 RepID=A0AA97P326_PYRO3|nr:hypothetical protein OOU_Y34scaffold00295g20 [Pyricularia oryzae Y34]